MSPRWIFVAGVVVVALLFLAMFAPSLLRSNPRRPRTLDDIELPCARLTEGTGWELLHQRSDLTTMSSGRYLQRRSDPILVDARMRIYETSNFTMKQSALGLMFSGPRMLDVTFDLHELTDRTPADAKGLLVKHVAWAPEGDTENLRQQVEHLDDLTEIVKLLNRDREQLKQTSDDSAADASTE